MELDWVLLASAILVSLGQALSPRTLQYWICFAVCNRFHVDSVQGSVNRVNVAAL